VEKQSFEKSMERLEQITSMLENDKIDVENAIDLFEEGTRLSKELTKKLTEAEQKITLLSEKAE